MSPQPGEVWLADLGLAAKFRPIVVISRHDPDAPRALVVYLPVTTQYRQSQYEVELPELRFLEQRSFVNVQGIGSLPLARLGRRLGILPVQVMGEIKSCLAWALEIDIEPSH